VSSSGGSSGPSERSPYVGMTADYHNADESLDRAEYEAKFNHHKRAGDESATLFQ